MGQCPPEQLSQAEKPVKTLADWLRAHPSHTQADMLPSSNHKSTSSSSAPRAREFGLTLSFSAPLIGCACADLSELERALAQHDAAESEARDREERMRAGQERDRAAAKANKNKEPMRKEEKEKEKESSDDDAEEVSEREMGCV